MKTAHKIIAISKPIAMEIEHKYGRLATVIPNGTEIPELSLSDTVLRKYNLMKGKYVLTVGRFVPEKGFDDLIDVADKFLSLKMSYQEPPTIFETIRYHKEPIRAALPTKILATYDEPPNKWKLVIVGTADHENNYSRQLKEKARRNSDIILTGFLSGQPLKELYSHAGLFVLPSYQEGLPIALLEAMSHGVSCLASDIPANREFHLDDARYFKAGDKKLLAEKIQRFIKTSLSWEEKQNLRNSIASVYNWKSIAKSTLTVYKSLCKLAVIHFLWLIENFMTYQDLFSKPL
ncbi:MAG: glycosyltransferase family 4 protein [Chitinivibrionales bacterium]|nr:glycosyltransferase family 4 protein [Chitinivibrionales bacterium]